MTPEADFRRCFRLEDDFTHHARQKQIWKIDTVDLAEKKLTATLAAKTASRRQAARLFDLLTSTRVLDGNGFGELEVAASRARPCSSTSPGPRSTAPAASPKSGSTNRAAQLATAQQLERHRDHIRERGLPGWVEAVDDEKQIVTITFFGGVDPKLFDELTGINDEPHRLAASQDAKTTRKRPRDASPSPAKA